jgi:predicted RNase H-like nuclease
LCCLSYQPKTASLTLDALTCKEAIADILSWIDAHAPPTEPAVIAVDAPTLIPNDTGMRVPDKLAHKYFGKYHAGCYPANLGRPFASRTIGFGQSLEDRGFQHDPHLSPPQPKGRYQLELFPHTATIHLFQLERILKYKKGTVQERRDGLNQLRDLLLATLPTLEPSLGFNQEMPLPLVPERGRAMKAVEDQLDSLVCAYSAAHWWYWGMERNWVLGDRTTGYIVIPTPFGRRP